MVEIKRLDTTTPDFWERLKTLVEWDSAAAATVTQTVQDIIEQVRQRGDAALLEYTRRFDRVEATAMAELEIPAARLRQALAAISQEQRQALELATARLRAYAEHQKLSDWSFTEADGTRLGQQVTPLDSVGLYVPGGKAAYPSSVLMNAIPAKVAGVGLLIMVVPTPAGAVNELVLAAAAVAGVDRVFAIGGAQAVAALAYGTATVPRVDKIVGPGNIYVSEAKRQVFGIVDIDMIAGPTELVIIANRHSDPKFIIADLKAQEEHAGGLAILITNSKSLAKEIEAQAGDINGFIILTKNIEQAAEAANKIAPEHLEILVNNPQRMLKHIRNAGAIFLGPYSPVAVGDYVAGPSHVLPTAGTARFFSGLSTLDFIKSNHIISYSKKALEKVREPLEKIAGIEGLSKHIESVKARFQ